MRVPIPTWFLLVPALVTAQPAPPRALTATACATGIHVAWTNPPQAITTYHVWHRPQPCEQPTRLAEAPVPIPREQLRVVSVSSEDVGYDGPRAIDGSPSTLWHTRWRTNPPPLPHHLVLDLGALHRVTGLTYTPRQDGLLHGTITRYAVFLSRDGQAWGTALAQGDWAGTPAVKTVTFAPTSGHYLKLVARRGATGHPSYAHAAELTVLATAEAPPAPFVLIGTVQAPRVAFEDSQPSPVGCYQITAVQADGQETGPSNQVQVP